MLFVLYDLKKTDKAYGYSGFTKLEIFRARSGLVGHSPRAPPAPVGLSRASEPPPPALASPSGVAGPGSGRIARLPGASAASLETGAALLVAAPLSRGLLEGRSGRSSAPSASSVDSLRHTAFDSGRPMLGGIVPRFLRRALTSFLLCLLLLTSLLINQRFKASRHDAVTFGREVDRVLPQISSSCR